MGAPKKILAYMAQCAEGMLTLHSLVKRRREHRIYRLDSKVPAEHDKMTKLCENAIIDLLNLIDIK